MLRFRLALTLFATTCLPALQPAAAQTLDLGELAAPTCPPLFALDKEVCKVAKPEVFTNLTAPGLCTKALGVWKDDKCAAPTEPRKATCSDKVAGLVLKDGKCQLDRSTPRSAKGDYLGDCFEFRGRPETGPLAWLKGGEVMAVVDQQKDAADPMLKLVEATGSGTGWCAAKTGSPILPALASDVVETGAYRKGWVYGVLAVPYKYYPSSKTIAPAASIGGYFGRRWGTPGSAYSFVGALTLGAVKGEIREASTDGGKTPGKILETPQLSALSGAFGFMWDLSKAPGAKPFKIGAFVGVDRVSRGEIAKYPQDGKPWLALQIGYDFTDN